VCIGAVGTLLRIDSCERLQLTAAAGQALVVSCHSCCLHLGTPRQPALLGDCRWGLCCGALCVARVLSVG
jgi:TBCC domain-containing protein 1